MNSIIWCNIYNIVFHINNNFLLYLLLFNIYNKLNAMIFYNFILLIQAEFNKSSINQINTKLKNYYLKTCLYIYI